MQQYAYGGITSSAANIPLSPNYSIPSSFSGPTFSGPTTGAIPLGEKAFYQLFQEWSMFLFLFLFFFFFNDT